MAKNHMEEVAKILGVEMGEKFEIKGVQGQFALLANGLYSLSECRFTASHFEHLMNGVAEIKRKPGKPKYGQPYWYISYDGEVESINWYPSTIDAIMYKVGNCYCTKEEAEANRDKWKAFYESDDVLEIGDNDDDRE